MRTVAAALVLCAGAAAQSSAPPNTLTPDEAKNGWILLFDGKSMDHWVDPRQKTPPGDAWTIEDECLVAKSHPRITEDLFSDRTFGDFDLVFDWKISPAGNSGVKYRIQDHLWVPFQRLTKFETMVENGFENRITQRPDHGQDYVVGFEYQITDDSSNRDATSNPKHTAGALYDMVVPSQHVSRPIGEFNHSRIVLRGNHVEHWLNGVKVVDAPLNGTEELQDVARRWSTAPHVTELLSKQPKKDCPISLQNHGNQAWFRSIKIRPLNNQASARK